MDEINALAGVDIKSWLITGILILFAIAAVAAVIEKISQIIGKPVKWLKNKDKDHEQLEEFVEKVQKYGGYYREMNDDMEKLRADMDRSGDYYKQLSERLDGFMAGMRESVDELKNSNMREDDRIEALGAGMIELLGSEFDRKFSHFVAIGGIPENELSAFTATFKAYEQLGGNHRRKEKYLYVIKRLDVLPVTTTVDLETEGNENEEEQA